MITSLLLYPTVNCIKNKWKANYFFQYELKHLQQILLRLNNPLNRKNIYDKADTSSFQSNV